MSSFLAKFFKGNPLGSITVAGVVAVVLSFLGAHFDASKLTPLGDQLYTIIGAVIGVLYHHSVTPTPPAK